MSILIHVAKSFGSAFIAYSSHYAINKFYNYACVPDGFYGYLHGFIIVGSPVCQATIQILNSTMTSYSTTIMIIISRTLIDLITSKSSQIEQPMK